MIEVSIGILIGLVLALIVLVATAHFRPSIDRSINQLIAVTKQKGEVIEPESEELADWIGGLPEK